MEMTGPTGPHRAPGGRGSRQDPPPGGSRPVLELVGISKRSGAMQVLDEVSLSLWLRSTPQDESQTPAPSGLARDDLGPEAGRLPQLLDLHAGQRAVRLHVEVKDFPRFLSEITASEANRRWQQHMAEIMDPVLEQGTGFHERAGGGVTP